MGYVSFWSIDDLYEWSSDGKIVVKSNIKQWLEERTLHIGRTCHFIDDGGAKIKLIFRYQSDALLFKLTWGGR